MKRKIELERIIVGSVLCNRAYYRDVVVLSAKDFDDFLTSIIFERLPQLVKRAEETGRQPIEVMLEDETQHVQGGKDADVIAVHAMELAAMYDYDWKMVHHIYDVILCRDFGGGELRQGSATFNDYVSTFIKLTENGNADNAA